MPKAKTDKIMFYGTGRRKSSIARVRLVEGKGAITINGKNIDEYLGTDTLKVIVRQPSNCLQILQINMMLSAKYKVEDLQVKLEQFV